MAVPTIAEIFEHLSRSMSFQSWVLLICGFSVYKIVTGYYRYRKSWVNVPIVGGRGVIGSWITAFQWMNNARQLVQEGYEKHGDFAFQVATASRWEVWICNDQMIKDYRNLMDDQFSAVAVTQDAFQTKYTLPGGVDAIHKIPNPAIAKALTWQRIRSTTDSDPYFSEFVEEFKFAFDVETNFNNGDWNYFSCFEVGARIVAHLTAKSMMGYPLCRDPEIIDLFVDYGNAVPISGFFIARFPELLKPIVAKFCRAPKISDRLDAIIFKEMGKRRVKPRKEPEDLTDWLWAWVQQNAPERHTELDVAQTVSATIFGAIHTTTQVLVHCLFELATRPEYVEPLRNEAEQTLERHGKWTKDGIESLAKLDSFIKECQRFNPLDAGSLARRATKNFTFSNGLEIPEGTYVFSPNSPVLFDETYYPNAHSFDGYRFYKLGKSTGRPHEHKFVATNLKYLQFGDARHTCPGRHMAADEIRLMLAHILINYDITTKNNGPRPSNWTFKKILFPDMKGEIAIKLRKTSNGKA